MLKFNQFGKKLDNTVNYLLSRKPVSAHDIIEQVSDRIPLYSMPAGNLTTGFDAVIKNGAFSTATVSLTGGYDNVVVGNEATPQNSYFRLTNRFFSANPIYVHLRVKVKALGTTPVIGIRTISASSPYVNFTNQQGHMYVNLSTGVVTSSLTGYGTTYDNNGFTNAVAADEILDMFWEWTYNGDMQLTIVKEKSALEISTRIITWSGISTQNTANIFYPSIILADGTYQLLSKEIGIVSPFRPKIALLGDSIISGASVIYADTIIGNLESKLPYKIANFSAPASLIAAHKAALVDIVKVKPKIVFYCAILESLFSNNADPANGSYTTWSTNYSYILNALLKAGITPVIFLPSDTPLYADSRIINVKNWLATNFPSIQYVERLATEGGIDGTGIHLNGVANSISADKFITLLRDNDSIINY